MNHPPRPDPDDPYAKLLTKYSRFASPQFKNCLVLSAEWIDDLIADCRDMSIALRGLSYIDIRHTEYISGRAFIFGGINRFNWGEYRNDCLEAARERLLLLKDSMPEGVDRVISLEYCTESNWIAVRDDALLEASAIDWDATVTHAMGNQILLEARVADPESYRKMVGPWKSFQESPVGRCIFGPIGCLLLIAVVVTVWLLLR